MSSKYPILPLEKIIKSKILKIIKFLNREIPLEKSKKYGKI